LGNGFKVLWVRPRSVHLPEYQLLAKSLRQTRLDHKLTQEEVAARLEKPRSFPHKVENGERELNIVELMDYCAALDEDFLMFVARFAMSVKQLRLAGESI
jgi:transcriptional regulator with XRE-family HTH domain